MLLAAPGAAAVEMVSTQSGARPAWGGQGRRRWGTTHQLLLLLLQARRQGPCSPGGCPFRCQLTHGDFTPRRGRREEEIGEAVRGPAVEALQRHGRLGSKLHAGVLPRIAPTPSVRTLGGRTFKLCTKQQVRKKRPKGREHGSRALLNSIDRTAAALPAGTRAPKLKSGPPARPASSIISAGSVCHACLVSRMGANATS